MKRFAEIIKGNLSTVLAINSVFALFALPSVAWCVICQCFSSLLLGQSQSVSAALVLWCIGNLPCVIVLFIGLALTSKACSNLYFDENANVKDSFSQGKKNILKYCLCALILWLSLSVLVLCFTWAPKIEMPQIVLVLCFCVTFLQFVFVLGWTFTCLTQNLFYKDKLLDVAKNSLKIIFIKPMTVLWTILSILPFVSAALLPFIWQLVAWLVVLITLPTFFITLVIVQHKKIFDRIAKK